MQTLRKIQLLKDVVFIDSFRMEGEKVKNSLDVFNVSDIVKASMNQSSIVFCIGKIDTYRFAVAKDHDLTEIANVINERYPGASIRVFSHFENVWRKNGDS